MLLFFAALAPAGAAPESGEKPKPRRVLTLEAVRAAQAAGTPSMEAQAIPSGPMGPGPGILGQRLFQRSVEEELRAEATAQKKGKDKR